MALIKCPECGIEVSDKALACPKCAYPFKNENATQKVQTVELTSKKLKLQSLLSGVATFTTLILWIIHPNSALCISLFVVSLICYITTLTLIWWHHA